MDNAHQTRRFNRRTVLKGVGAAAVLGPAAGALFSSCSVGGKGNGGGGGGAGAPASTNDIAKERGLTPEDVAAALKTYVPSGRHDEYLMFTSGGHSGQLLVIGIPSMRLLRVIGVFAPEPWQGWGYSDASRKVLEEGGFQGKTLTVGDTHHPALSETNAQYDGQFVFINEKIHGRVAVIDLRDFETKQIVKNPLTLSNHACFVTPNTEYVVEGCQYATPLGGAYAPLEEFEEKYRGAITFWKFNRERGRIVPEESFAVELPPYFQDLGDAGRGASDGWVFLNSLNTEMATGGIQEGKPPLEIGASQREMDYLSVVNWKKAEEVARAGKVEMINGFPVITIKTAVEEGILFQVPEPKSPHGVDVTPDGAYIVVSGKLDPHVTVYSMKKIEEQIAKGNYETDSFGIPVLDFAGCMEAQVELGLGPLHTQFDDKGYAYTSLFIDSAVARWKLGGEGTSDGWKFVEKIPVHYNVGHIAAVQGDTIKPGGKFLVALNKWSVDRFAPVGPLLPQNLQLIDISGETMQLLYDMPIGIGEPHYAQIIPVDLLKPWEVYPETGWEPGIQAVDAEAAQVGNEGVERNGSQVTVRMTALRSHFTPDIVRVKQGDTITWHITNVENAHDATHGFVLPGVNVSLSLEPGESNSFTFTAEHPGVYPFYCTEFCAALHLEMMGYLIVEPS